MLVNMRELLGVAERGHFAVPAFNISNYAMFNGIIDISEQKSAPVIIEIHPNELKHIGTDVVAGMVRRAESSTVPVVIHLDHGASFENVMVAIRAGFTSVMIDASGLPFEENVAACQKVVEAAHAAISYVSCSDDGDPRRAEVPDGDEWHYVPSQLVRNVSVEGELGNIGTTEVDKAFDQVIHYTQPDEAVRFVAETGIDCLAVAIGTCHGLYPKGYVPQLKLDLLRTIKQALADADLDCRLVLHGGSNNPDDEIAEAARIGITKINISSDIKAAYYQEMRRVLENQALREPNEIEPSCIKAMQAVAAQKIDLFGCAGKAALYR